ncbi:acyl-CoA dehydrogenase family protein [Mesorhizobium sp. ANAO-SY3R2]|uniref:acyl-CoA dehydrogenase family protein n=1 Tax=Mesorhizobium sp. ANAO-SY3R2 TaxID=3166644 RepID=UPI00366D1BC8
MDLRLDEQQRLLRDSAERFLRDEYAFDRRRALIAETAPGDPGMWSKLSELGWLGVWLPEEEGGLGGSEIELSVVAEQMGRALYVGPFLPANLCAAALREAGTEHGSALLGSIADGSVRAALAHAEPGSRGILDAVSTVASPSPAGTLLTGRKRLVHSAQFADRLLVSALLDGELAFFSVDPQQAGVAIHPLRTIDNDWAADVDLNGAVGELVVEPASAKAAKANVVFIALLAIGSEALGLCEAAFEQTQEYLRTRQQFGRALVEFQALQHRLADIFVEIEQLRASLLGALSVVSAAPAARAQAAYGLKVQAGAVACSVAGQCLHLHGGMGMTDEMPVSHYYRRARVLEAQFGNSDYFLAAYGQGMA